MTRTRAVRLPANVPLSALSVDGGQPIVSDEDGRRIVEFAGVLRINGQPVLSPGQLLELWSGRALVEYTVADATLRPDDAMPMHDKARFAAYAVGADTARRARELGHGDEKIAVVLEAMRKQFVDDGQAHATTASQRAFLAEVNTILLEMIATWELATTFEWSNDG